MEPEHDDEDREFFRRFGPWERHTPASAAALFEGYPAPWWIAGGWSIQAFSGVERGHDDVDVAICRRDIPALRSHFAGRFDLWAVGSGMLRPLDDRHPAVPRWAAQVWMREHALAPWQVDIVLTPGTHREWIFRLDRSITRPIAQAVWTADDGLRYLRPELALAFKARLRRAKDDRDLDAALPRLDDQARAWLAAYVRKAHPDHPWIPRLAS